MSSNSEKDELLFNFLNDFLQKECKLGKITATKIAIGLRCLDYHSYC